MAALLLHPLILHPSFLGSATVHSSAEIGHQRKNCDPDGKSETALGAVSFFNLETQTRLLLSWSRSQKPLCFKWVDNGHQPASLA